MSGDRFQGCDLVAGQTQGQRVGLETLDRRTRNRDHPLAPEVAVLEDEQRDPLVIVDDKRRHVAVMAV